MPSTAAAQKMPAPGWAASDPDFTPAFYRPYEAAVETAFVMLCAARRQLQAALGGDGVRAVTFRLKSPASIRGKLRKKGLPATPAAAGAALRDIAGLRVVFRCEEEIYRFARLLRESPVAQHVATHDYIAEPKPSGYRSLHLLLRVPVCVRSQAMMVPVEIQLRTAVMDAWASAEHGIVYKPAR